MTTYEHEYYLLAEEMRRPQRYKNDDMDPDERAKYEEELNSQAIYKCDVMRQIFG